MKRHTTEREKIFTNRIADMGLIYKLYNGFILLESKKK